MTEDVRSAATRLKLEMALRQFRARKAELRFDVYAAYPVNMLIDAVEDTIAALNEPTAAEAAMAEIWGLLCPDCGPNDYGAITAAVADLSQQIAQQETEIAESKADGERYLERANAEIANRERSQIYASRCESATARMALKLHEAEATK